MPFSCGETRASADETTLPEEERAARDAYDCAPISITGRLLSADGTPIRGARLSAQDREGVTDDDGRFQLRGLARRNALLTVEALGHRRMTLPLWLRRGLEESDVDMDAIVLAPEQADRTRLTFTGDFALGRRFLDTSGTTPRDQLPPDDPNALIQSSNPAPGSREVVRHVAPLTKGSDLTVVNLESPVTDEPWTPHATKDFAFFTLPGSLVALHELGARYVSLGNNHVYDYEEKGVEDTLRHLKAAGIASSGAGRNADEAFTSWNTTLGGTSYSFVSACSIAGEDHDVDYVASATKGGAADLRDSARMAQAIAEGRSGGHVPIALLHTGIEYSEIAGGYANERGKWVIDQGAELVIAHHPHRVQGVSRHAGRLVFDSLGNFAFDQDRLETMIGGLAEVDLVAGKVDRASLVPIYLEDYRPRPIAGRLADVNLRQLADDSRLGGASLVPSNGRGVVLPEGTSPATSERTVTLQVPVPASGVAVVDLRALRREGESLSRASVEGGAGTLRTGRDILHHGDFEDYDVDDDVGELTRWHTQEGLASGCMRNPAGGATSLCLKQLTTSSVGASLRNRLRVPGDVTNAPNKSLTLVGAVRGNAAGKIEIDASYHASEGDAEFGGETLLHHPGGDFEWTRFMADLSMPADVAQGTTWNSARALRLFLTHHGGPGAQGEVAFDDLAVVAWDGGAASASVELATPNARDFLRLEAAPGATRTVAVILRNTEP